MCTSIWETPEEKSYVLLYSIRKQVKLLKMHYIVNLWHNCLNLDRIFGNYCFGLRELNDSLCCRINQRNYSSEP
jgi:hypothetical protein